MTRDLPEPLPEVGRCVEAVKPPGQQRAHAALDDLLRWASLHGYVGAGYIRVSFNQGGVTAARVSLEGPLPPS